MLSYKKIGIISLIFFLFLFIGIWYYFLNKKSIISSDYCEFGGKTHIIVYDSQSGDIELNSLDVSKLSEIIAKKYSNTLTLKVSNYGSFTGATISITDGNLIDYLNILNNDSDMIRFKFDANGCIGLK